MDLPQIREYAPILATPHDIARTHFCVPRVEDQTTEAHLIAAGASILLADEIASGRLKNGFALVRPPGHHANLVVHGNRGFCNINNEAIMVDYLRRYHGKKRLAIIDTDVHHGDGTQNVFWHDPDVLCISFHQDGRTIYPGTGFTNELGGPSAYARTINVPLPPGTTDEGILYVVDNLILPILREFKPDFIVNSAGQDNHYTDPLGSMNVTAQGYAKLTEKLRPDLAVLEGGYAIETALPYVNMGIILALAGLDYSNVREPDLRTFTQSASITKEIHQNVDLLLKTWEKRDQVPPNPKNIEGNFYQQSKRFYYDTDGISEGQQEKLRLCNNCPGYLIIITEASSGRGRALCISIPFSACPTCRSEAEEIYTQEKKANDFRYLYLQDKPADIFRIYDRPAGTEEVSEG
jgi:acetoin utilization deacetylase AcuC-like enzyme